MYRPRIAILGRFSTNTSALRYRAVVGAQALLESIWRAGGEPVMLLPSQGFGAEDWQHRLAGFDGVLLPGGGDLDPSTYGEQAESEHIYDVNPIQDAQDLSMARYILDHGLPFLAICRGAHVINVALGGTLHQHIEPMHRHLVHEVVFDRQWDSFGLVEERLTCSCYHHQAINLLGAGLSIVATASDGVVEGLVLENSRQGVCVQWHPEDTSENDGNQQAIFDSFIERCR